MRPMRSSLLVLAFILTGCAVSREVRLADGWPAFEIKCGGPLASFGDCLEKAGDICPRGYDVLDKLGGELPTSATAMPSGGVANISLHSGARKLFVKCH